MTNINIEPNKETAKKNTSNLKIFALVLILFLAVGGYYLYKAKDMAVIVNGESISRSEIVKELETTYGATIVDQKIDILLLTQAVRSSGVEVTNEEVQAKISEFRTQMSAYGQELEAVLEMQGYTMARLESDLKIQLGIEKMFENEIQVTDKDIDDYIAQVKASQTEEVLAQIDFNAERETIRGMIKEEKLAEKRTELLAELKANAEIKQIVQY